MSSINYDKWCTLCFDDNNVIEFFQNKNTLHKMCTCKNNHGINIYIGPKIVRRYTRKVCKLTKGICPDTNFGNSRMPFLEIIKFIYWWSKELTSTNLIVDGLRIGKCTTIVWNNYLREVCTSSL